MSWWLTLLAGAILLSRVNLVRLSQIYSILILMVSLMPYRNLENVVGQTMWNHSTPSLKSKNHRQNRRQVLHQVYQCLGWSFFNSSIFCWLFADHLPSFTGRLPFFLDQFFDLWGRPFQQCLFDDHLSWWTLPSACGPYLDPGSICGCPDPWNFRFGMGCLWSVLFFLPLYTHETMSKHDFRTSWLRTLTIFGTVKWDTEKDRGFPMEIQQTGGFRWFSARTAWSSVPATFWWAKVATSRWAQGPSPWSCWALTVWVDLKTLDETKWWKLRLTARIYIKYLGSFGMSDVWCLLSCFWWIAAWTSLASWAVGSLDAIQTGYQSACQVSLHFCCLLFYRVICFCPVNHLEYCICIRENELELNNKCMQLQCNTARWNVTVAKTAMGGQGKGWNRMRCLETDFLQVRARMGTVQCFPWQTISIFNPKKGQVPCTVPVLQSCIFVSS